MNQLVYYMCIISVCSLLLIILKVVSYGSEEVAEKAIMILKDVFTNLGPRLLSNQVSICYFLYTLCTDCILCLTTSKVCSLQCFDTVGWTSGRAFGL